MSKIRDTPTPGYQYIIKEGDWLSIISGIVYGDINKWPIIWRANIPRLRSGDPNIIFPGEIIWIPPKDFLQFPEKLTNKNPDDLTIIINNVEIPIISARIVRTMNTMSDMWSATIAWNPGKNEKLDSATRPYGYQSAAAYLGEKLMVGGALYVVEPSFITGGRTKNLTGYSFTIDAVDSNLKPPYEANKISLKKRAEDLLNPLGVGIDFQNEEVELRANEIFDRVTATPIQDRIFTHLASLAAQKNLLLSSTPQGNVLFLKANTDGNPVGSIEEASDTFTGLGALEYSAIFDGRKRFNAYKVISQTSAKINPFAVSKDDNVSRPRFKNILANNVLSGGLQEIADWERSKALAEAMTIPFPVSTWYAPDGNLWAENTLLTVKSPTLFIDDGYTFLIQKVEFIYEENGISALLSLVPPQVYTNEPVDEPWI